MSNETSAEAQRTNGAGLSGVGCTGGFACLEFTPSQLIARLRCIAEDDRNDEWHCEVCAQSADTIERLQKELRAANKGAERNAHVARLAIRRASANNPDHPRE